jgi:glycosyltransferase involved in cell wall biosynthesis
MKQTFTVTVEGFPATENMAEFLDTVLNDRLSCSVRVEAQGEPVEDENRDGPLVSILLPNYNYAHRVEKMIASVRAQTIQDYELIVVDDGSSDDSIARIRPLLAPKDRLLLHGKNLGAAAAINTAAEAATGRFMTWVSSDNEMTPAWLEALLDVFKAHGDTGVAYANYDRFNDAGPQLGKTWGMPYDPSRLLADQNCYIGPAFLVRAEVWRETGGLRGKNSCDYDHWLRIEETCQRRGLTFRYHGEVLCHYYAGAERSTVARRQDYDANVWQAEARKRRGVPHPLASVGGKPVTDLTSKVVSS